MSVKWMGEMWDSGLEGAELLMALAIADHADHEGRCWPGTDLLMRKTKLGKRQVQRIVHSLSEKGIFRIIAGSGRGHKTIYEFQKVTPATPFVDPERVTYATPFNPGKGDTSDTLSDQEKVTSTALKGDISSTERVTSSRAREEEPSLEPSLEPKKATATAASPRSAKKSDEKLKTRPDIVDDRAWLDHLRGLDENRGIDIVGLYDRMIAWCLKKRETPSRLRLLKWLEDERSAVPVSYMPAVSRSGEPSYFKGPDAVDAIDAPAFVSPDNPLRPAENVPPEQQRVWQAVLDAVKLKLNIDVFNTWFKPLIFDGFNDDNNAFEIRCGQITKDWICMYYAGMIAEILPDLGLGEFTIRWTVDHGEYEEAIAA